MTIEIVAARDPDRLDAELETCVDRAFAWFREVETVCSRFDPDSELMRLSRSVGTPVAVSPLLFEAVRFACAVAAETDGAFDPTVGASMMARGFDVEYRSGARVAAVAGAGAPATFRDLALDDAAHTIALARPLLLDLGGVAKGLAIDMAARELAPLVDYAIDAGGDLYLAGTTSADERWTVGIADPRGASGIAQTIRVTNAAVCTSGDYERRSPTDGASHLIDPRDGRPAGAAISATVIAPTAIAADALATAAFVLGPAEGLALLRRQGVEGQVIAPDLSRHATPGFGRG